MLGYLMQVLGAQQDQYGMVRQLEAAGRRSRFCLSPSQTLPLCRLHLQYMVDCSQVNSLPTLSFVISGVALPLPPSAYIIQVRYTFRDTVFQWTRDP